MKRLILFFTRHKIVFGLFVLVFLIVLSRLVHHPEREYVKPLEKMLIERYGDRGLTMERAWFDEDSRKVFSLDLAVSKELAESKDVMKVCYEVQELIADYMKKNQEHFSLNDKEELSLSFYIGKKGILPRGFYLLKFTNENAHRELSKDRSCKYENDFVRCYVCEGELKFQPFFVTFFHFVTLHSLAVLFLCTFTIFVYHKKTALRQPFFLIVHPFYVIIATSLSNSSADV